jgi:hypothetical protein
MILPLSRRACKDAVYSLLPDVGVDILGDQLFLIGIEGRRWKRGVDPIQDEDLDVRLSLLFLPEPSRSASCALIVESNSRLACFTRSRDGLSIPSFNTRTSASCPVAMLQRTENWPRQASKFRAFASDGLPLA